MFERYDFAQ
jgi:hypothetical protein